MNKKLALIFTGASLAITTAVSPVLAQGHTSKWACRLLHKDNQYVGDVEIWWGHTEGDASWACNEWISECGNNGGCWARRI